MARTARRLLLFAACVSCVQAQAPPAPLKPGKVSLTIVDSITKQPIANSRLLLRDFRSREVLSRSPETFVTNEQGRAELSNVPPGEYIFNIMAGRSYSDDFERRGPILVKEGESLDAGTISLVPNGTIEGTVTGENGKPLDSASVQTIAIDPFARASRRMVAHGFANADAHGHYRIEGVQPGRVFVKVIHPYCLGFPANRGCPSTLYPNAVDFAQAIRLDVQPGAVLERIDFRLRSVPLFHIRGHVSGQLSSPGYITLHDCDSDLPEGTTILGGMSVEHDGSFDLEGVLPGIRCILFHERGPEPVRETKTYAQQTILVVDRDVEDVQIGAKPPLRISGTIVFEKGAEHRMPSFINLSPERQLFLEPIYALIDSATGNFRVDGVLDEDYRISVNGGAGYIKSIKYGYRDVSDGVFNAAGESAPLTIQVAAAGGSLTGKTVGSIKPIKSAQVIAAPVGALSSRVDLVRTTSMDENGDFQFNSLAPVAYKMVAFPNLDTRFSQAPEFLNQLSGTNVIIEDGQEPNVEVRIISNREIEEAKRKF